MAADKYSLLRRILKTIGLSHERIDELISWIRTWLLDDTEKKTGETKYPYQLRDDFLSPAEHNFMRVLRTASADSAMIAPKVSLGDLFYAQTGDFSQNRVCRNIIERKHFDFLLYDPHTLRPIPTRPATWKSCAIEPSRESSTNIARKIRSPGGSVPKRYAPDFRSHLTSDECKLPCDHLQPESAQHVDKIDFDPNPL